MTSADLTSMLPVGLLVVWACVLLLLDVFLLRRQKGVTAMLAAAGLIGVLVLTIAMPPSGGAEGFFSGMVLHDGFVIFLNVLFLLSGLIGVALAYDYLQRMGLDRGEYYVLLLFSIAGMMLMASANDLIIIFLALELLSFPLYVLSAFARPRPESEEAGLKYFLLGAFSTSFVVYGIALVFGATRTTNLAAILAAVGSPDTNLALLVIGAALLMVGLGFKVAAVPFHMWTPDVYQGAPTPIVAFMAYGAKAGGFAGLLRLLMTAFPDLGGDLVPVIWVVSALTMLVGNILAIAQSNIKRLLAYSSIAHAGYILMALTTAGKDGAAQDGVASALFYLLAYALTNFAAWSVVIALERAEGQGLALDDFAGLGRKYPFLAAVMAVAMLSFTGVPPTLGFVGKLYLFRAVLDAGYIDLAIIGVLTSLISAYYYLRVVIIMYMRDGEPVARRDTWLNVAAFVSAVGTFFLIIFAGPLFEMVYRAVIP